MYRYTIVRVESIDELRENIEEKNIYFSDNIYNRFDEIYLNGEKICGLVYYDYGISVKYYIDVINSRGFIGFGKKIICIDSKGKLYFEEELDSIFYELQPVSFGQFLIVICELDVYCFNCERLIWKIGFKDIVSDFNIIDNDTIEIISNEKDSFIFKVSNGVLLS